MVRRATLLCFSLSAQGIAATNIWLADFYRAYWTASVVTPDGNFLYIDGGEVWNGSDQNANFNVLQSTIIIDLRESWTNENVTASSAPKPTNFPLSRYPVFWYSDAQNSIYSYGGWVYDDDAGSCPSPCDGWTASTNKSTLLQAADVGQPLWQLNVGASSAQAFTGSWTASSSQPQSDTPPTWGSLSVSVGETLYSYGGLVIPPDGTAYTIPGLAQIDQATGGSINKTTSSYAFLGQAVFAPMFGTQGVIIYIGGSNSLSQTLSLSTPDYFQSLESLATINVIDVASGNFWQQDATAVEQPLAGLPPPRFAFCAAGVADSDGHFDIFLHGGQGDSSTTPDDLSDFSTVYILSLPSFRWTQVANSEQTPRMSHTCDLIGENQIVVVGGTEPYVGMTKDPWPNGINVFDMSTLAWTGGYNANGQPYVRADSLIQSLSGYQYPPSWNTPGIKKLFFKQTSSHTGAIAGGAVGGVVVLAIMGVLIFWFFRRRQRHNRNAAPLEKPNSPLAELHGQYRYRELAVEHPEMRGDDPGAWELEARPAVGGQDDVKIAPEEPNKTRELETS